MTDREMLELAAMAASYRVVANVWNPGILYLHDGEHENQMWNPLTDDGDALRLAVKLGIQACWHQALGYATAHYDYGSSKREEYGQDPYAATRRAITRAAAEIGRTMKENQDAR